MKKILVAIAFIATLSMNAGPVEFLFGTEAEKKFNNKLVDLKKKFIKEDPIKECSQYLDEQIQQLTNQKSKISTRIKTIDTRIENFKKAWQEYKKPNQGTPIAKASELEMFIRFINKWQPGNAYSTEDFMLLARIAGVPTKDVAVSTDPKEKYFKATGVNVEEEKTLYVKAKNDKKQLEQEINSIESKIENKKNLKNALKFVALYKQKNKQQKKNKKKN